MTRIKFISIDVKNFPIKSVAISRLTISIQSVEFDKRKKYTLSYTQHVEYSQLINFR